MNKVVKFKIMHLFSAAAAITFIVLLFLYAAAAKKGAFDGVLASGEIVVPSLFPFMVASLFLTRIGLPRMITLIFDKLSELLFKNHNGAGMILSFLSGFPVGAKIVAEEYENGQIDAAEATAKMTYYVNAGPAFIITAVGLGLLQSQSAGVLMFGSVTLAAVINGFLFSHILITEKRIVQPTGNKNLYTPGAAFVTSVGDTAVSMVQIAGFVVLFSTIIGLFGKLILNHTVLLAASQILEVTVGSIMNKDSSLAIIAAGISFGGLSVIFQVLFCVRKVPIDKKIFFLSRLTHTVLSYIITKTALLIFPLHAPAMLSSGTPSPSSGFSISLALAMILMSVTLICSSQNAFQKRDSKNIK